MPFGTRSERISLRRSRTGSRDVMMKTVSRVSCSSNTGNSTEKSADEDKVCCTDMDREYE